MPRQIILDAEEVITPDIVLAEISKKYQRERIGERRTRLRLETIASTSFVAPITTTMALGAGRAYIELVDNSRRERRKSPSLFDGIILATAREYHSKVITGDQHFESVPESILI